MNRYTIRKIIKFTETVVVSAENASDAREKAMEMDGERNYDDHLDDIQLVGVEETLDT